LCNSLELDFYEELLADYLDVHYKYFQKFYPETPDGEQAYMDSHDNLPINEMLVRKIHELEKELGINQ